MKFLIKGALGGGFGGVGSQDGEIVEAKDYDQAYRMAEELAREEYESYEGLHGIRDLSDIMEEEGCSEEDAVAIYEEDIESWIEYTAEEVK